MKSMRLVAQDGAVLEVTILPDRKRPVLLIGNEKDVTWEKLASFDNEEAASEFCRFFSTAETVVKRGER